MLLLQLRQHSSFRDTGVRGEIIFVTKIHTSPSTREREREIKINVEGDRWVGKVEEGGECVNVLGARYSRSYAGKK